MHHEKNSVEVLLDVARDAIGLRAARDGHESGTYNTEEDPEGYVTSLLNALHHWCDYNAIDWEAELGRAEECYLQDVEENRRDAGVAPCPVPSELACPNCSHTGHFFIQATVNLLVDSDGNDLEGDEGAQWSRYSSCACPNCHHTGYLFQFHNPMSKE